MPSDITSLYYAIGKSMASRYAVYAFNALSLMVLTHTFKPEVFGVVAAAQTIVTLFQLVAEGGLSPAIINLNKLESNDRNGIFGLSLFIGLSLAIFMWLLGPVLADFYNMKDVTRIVPFVSIALFCNTAAVLPLALLQRQQLFKRMAQAGIIAELIALILTFIAYFELSALQAYALYFPIKASVFFLVNWEFCQDTEFGRPLPGRHFAAIKPLLGTTGYQLGFNFINYFSRNLDSILVGKYFGAAPLGIYNRAYQLMRYPLSLLTFAMTPAIQPNLRGNIDNVQNVNRLHRDLVFKLSILGSIAGLSVFFLAKYIVLIAFGQEWSVVVPIIKLLALIIPVQMIVSTSGSFFQAFNRTNLMFRVGVLSALFNTIAIIIGIWFGKLETLCWSLFVSFHINFFLIYYVMHKQMLGGKYFEFLKNTSPFLLTVFIMVVITLTYH